MTIASLHSFPFGQPALPIAGSPPGHRDCLVIGSLPAALAIRWRIPGGKLVQGFVVDNEPSPYWDGRDQETRIATWRRTVMWQDSWGEAAPTRSNGHNGRWLDQHVLAALGLTRDRVCATTLVETYHANEAARHRIDECYRPLIERLGLLPCALPNQPGNEALVHEAVTTQRERLLALVRSPELQSVITLGTAAYRALAELLGPAATPAIGHPLADGPAYGQVIALDLGGRTLRWQAFVSPVAPASMQRVHAGWCQRMGVRTLAQVGSFK